VIRPSLFAMVMGAAFGLLATLQPVSDSDLFWHLETGRRTLAGDLPRTDLFSWTVTGEPVFTDQWLGDALIAAAHALAGWSGVLALRAAVVAMLVGVVVDTAMSVRPGRPIVAIAAALPAIALSRFAWTDRPELLGLLCFAILVRLLRGRDRELLLALPLLLVWAQLHGSYAIGLVLILGSCVARAIEDDRERWRYVPIAAFAVLATLLTPSGLAAWTSAGGHFLAPPRFVSEEGVPDARTLPGLFFLATLSLVVATATLGRRATLREGAIIVPVIFLSLTAARHTPYLAVAAVAFFASRWPDPLAATRSSANVGPDRGPLARGLVVATFLVVLAVTSLDERVDESAFPRAALASVPSGRGVLNLYNWGGWMIWTKPDTPVFIDGRLFPYVPEAFADYQRVVSAAPGWEDIVARRGVTTIFVGANDAIAVRAPERGWRVVYRDAQAVVLSK
jgi:hypothetical protein